MDKRIKTMAALLGASFLWCVSLHSQVPIVQPDLGEKTYIAPAFFGPNAFQVPEMNDGRTTGNFQAEVAGDYIKGHLVKGAGDDTWDFFLKFRIPLFSDRVNLTLWAPLMEWYKTDRAVLDARRVDKSVSGSGHETGAAYISADILVLKETEKRPSIVLRSVLRTALEDKAFGKARSYDCPGYFFDVSAGKNLGPFRVAASTGFLCWQTDNGRQNDAVMFGVMGEYFNKYFDLSAQYGGYVGWEKCGDFPRTLRVRCDGGPSGWCVRPFVMYQHGFNDWPFDQLRAGVSVSLRKKAKE